MTHLRTLSFQHARELPRCIYVSIFLLRDIPFLFASFLNFFHDLSDHEYVVVEHFLAIIMLIYFLSYLVCI